MICMLFSCCRHILAALHFNFNLHRDNKVNQDGSVSLKVTYPKFKNGEATVRNRKIEPNFGIYPPFIQQLNSFLSVILLFFVWYFFKNYYLVFVQWTFRLCWRTLQVLHDPKQTATSRCMQWHEENGSSANEQHSMLVKQPREEAIRMREKRMNMVTAAVPPTAPSGMFLELQAALFKI